jgi:hypothetical protein
MNQLTFWRHAPGRFRVHNHANWLLTAIVCLCGLLAANTLVAADFTVTTPGFSYTINSSGPNPNLTLVRGKTYTFSINAASNHPFEILSAGVLNNNVSQ